MTTDAKGMLVLEDGSAYVGRSMGAHGEWVGEVVFNTGMGGYQESITDPSYWGQMVVFTCPHIGNVGVTAEDEESRQPFVRAVVARRICERPSNWRSQGTLPDYLRQAGVPALSGVDTRRITLTLRDKGVMRGALSTVALDAERLLDLARNAPDLSLLSPVDEVTCQHGYAWESTLDRLWLRFAGHGSDREVGAGPHVVVVDCGAKYNIFRHLTNLGARVTVAPAHASAIDIMALRPDGVLISNGPGDPARATATIATAQALLGQVPLFGICLGHQILALAAGGRNYKLPFGHHGENHPVQDLITGEVEITSQNHNYAIDPDSLQGLPFAVTHLSLFDQTIEGIRHKELPIASVQFHPEASPGPHDSLHVLRRFVASLTPSEVERHA
jgi:carbamoyl-phosphate synthase small subunit